MTKHKTVAEGQCAQEPKLKTKHLLKEIGNRKNNFFYFTIPPGTCKEAKACKQGVTIFTN